MIWAVQPSYLSHQSSGLQSMMASSKMAQHLTLAIHQTTFAIQVLHPIGRQQTKKSNPHSCGKGIGLAEHEDGIF